MSSRVGGPEIPKVHIQSGSLDTPNISIPHPNTLDSGGPKTPADEGILFFESAPAPGDGPIIVYELKLEEDGGPNQDRAVS